MRICAWYEEYPDDAQVYNSLINSVSTINSLCHRVHKLQPKSSYSKPRKESRKITAQKETTSNKFTKVLLVHLRGAGVCPKSKKDGDRSGA